MDFVLLPLTFDSNSTDNCLKKQATYKKMRWPKLPMNYCYDFRSHLWIITARSYSIYIYCGCVMQRFLWWNYEVGPSCEWRTCDMTIWPFCGFSGVNNGCCATICALIFLCFSEAAVKNDLRFVLGMVVMGLLFKKKNRGW